MDWLQEMKDDPTKAYYKVCYIVSVQERLIYYGIICKRTQCDYNN